MMEYAIVAVVSTFTMIIANIQAASVSNDVACISFNV